MNDNTTRRGPYGDAPRDYTWSELREDETIEFSLDEDPWAWASREATADRPVDVSQVHVTAVLVAFDAARWLPATLAALDHLKQRPARLIAIDNGSSDATRTLLDRAYDHGVLDAVYPGNARLGFGQAVKAALRQDRGRSAEDTDVGARVNRADEHHWLWLLHDDAAPAPDALYQLVAHVTTDRKIDITGPKLLLPRRRHGGQPLAEIGVSISGTGRRELQIDTGEIDQGQRDVPQERLGVSTCGMLVRTAVWQDLDGLDPALPVFRDGVEFGWRAHLNGYRVVTTPLAEMTHRQVGRAGLRPKGLTGRRPGTVDRLLGMVVVAGHAPGKMLPLVWLRLVWSCLLHAVGYLLGKVPGRALDEILAMASFVADPSRIKDLRTRTASIDPAPGTEEVVASLRPPWWGSLRVAGDALGGALSDRYRSVAGDADASSLDELTGDDFSSVAEDRPKYAWLNPVIMTTVLAVVSSLVAARGLLGTGALAGGSLLPAQATLSALWDSVWNPIPGAPGQSSPPWLALMAVGSTVLAGQPEWFVTLLICGVVPLAFLTAYPVARRAINDRRVRLWVAVTYALLPVLLGGTNQGRLTLSVVAILLPLLATAARALVLRRVRTPEAWRGGWGAGVVLVVLVAFEPTIIFIAVLLGALGLVVLRRTPRKMGRVGIAIGLPLLVLLPWLPSLITAPGRLFVGPDSVLDGASAAPQVWRLMIGRGLGVGLPPLWVGAVVFGMIWIVALIGLGRRSHRRVVLASWITGLVALAAAVGVSRLVVSVPPTGTEVRPWAGAYLLIGFAALLFAGGIGVDGLSQQMKERSFGWLQPATVVAGFLVAVVTVGAAGWWVWAGARGPIDRENLNAIPPYVLNAMVSDTRPRVLAIDLSGTEARYSVLSEGHVRLGDADRGFAFGGSSVAAATTDDLVVRIVAGSADDDISPQLTALGIGYLWVSGASDDERSRIDNTPGLGTASGNDRGIIWQLQPAVSRTTVAGAQGLVAVGRLPFVISAGGEGRVLRLGEAQDPRWRAELDGRPLTPVEGGWQQAYALPAQGGTVTVTLASSAHWFLFAQGLVLLVAGVLAAPGVRRPELRDPTKSARRAATLSEVV
ncbi:MAG TPA: glycosyltransferase [Propionibacteriaceae bacterium]